MSCLSSTQMSKMLDAITGYCSNAPTPVKVHAISHVVERFCKDIGGIRIHLGPVSMTHDNGIYFAVAPFGGVVFDVKNVIINGEAMRGESYKVFYRDDGRASVTIPSGNDSSNELEMDVLWRPGERTAQMPQVWFDKHFDALMHGCVAAVLAQIGTAWGNPQLAAQFQAEYSRDVHDCIYESRAADNANGRLSCFDPNERWI